MQQKTTTKCDVKISRVSFFLERSFFVASGWRFGEWRPLKGLRLFSKWGKTSQLSTVPKGGGRTNIYIYITKYILVECFFGDAILILGVFLFLDATFSILIFIFYSQNPGGL